MGRAKTNNTSVSISRIIPRQDSTRDQLDDLAAAADSVTNFSELRRLAVKNGLYDAEDLLKTVLTDLQQEPLSNEEAINLKNAFESEIGWDESISNLKPENINGIFGEEATFAKRLDANGLGNISYTITSVASHQLKSGIEGYIGWDTSISALSSEEIQLAFSESFS